MAILLGVAVSRLLFRSHYLYDIDSVNFALALRRFDPAVYQPHPPGYFLYVCLGRLANLLFTDANTALVAVSVLASCGAAALIYALADAWFGRKAAVFAGLLFLFSPLSWFHGTVAMTYIVEAFFSALIGYLCWQSYSGRTAFLIPSALALGAAAGFRQSSLLLLAPLWLASLRKARRNQVIAGLAALLASLLAWFLPMVRASGGIAAYLAPLQDLWRVVLAKHTFLRSPLALSAARLCTILGIYGLLAGGAAWLPLAARSAGVQKEKKQFTWIWIGPGLLFFTFIFLRFINSGYLLVLSPPVFAWLGRCAARLDADWHAPRSRKLALTTALAAANTAVFLYAPVYCSYKAVKDFEAELVSVNRSIRAACPPRDTVIVGFDSHFLGYRHAAYYLPEYLTVQFPEVQFAAGKRVFTVRDRDTRVVGELSLAAFPHFVFYPLPAGAEYSQYIEELRRRLPAGSLQTAGAGGRGLLIGSTPDLALLFPATLSLPARPYTANHGAR